MSDNAQKSITAKLPRLNLSATGIAEFKASGTIPWQDSFDEWLSRVGNFGENDSPDGERRFFMSGTTYSRNKVRHVITAIVDKGQILDETFLYLSVDYDCTPRAQAWQIPESFSLESTFLDFVRDINVGSRWTCRTVIAPLARSPQDLWFPIPMIVGDRSRDAFEIRGIQAAKLATNEDDGDEYRFSLGYDSNKNVTLTIDFHLEGPFDGELPKRVFDRTNAIFRRLVIPTKETP